MTICKPVGAKRPLSAPDALYIAIFLGLLAEFAVCAFIVAIYVLS